MARYRGAPPDYQPGLSLSLRNDPEGGTLCDPVLQSPLPDTYARREAVVLVHGFNNHYGEAATAYLGFRNQQYRRLDTLIPPALEALFADTHWPGDAAWGIADCVDFLVYPAAVGTARQAGFILAEHLLQMPNLEIVHFIAHSLGCRVVLETIRYLGNRPQIGKVCLMAAAVPVNKVEWGGELALAMTRPSRVLVLYSASDLVLSATFPAGQTVAPGDEGFFPTALGHERPPSSVAGTLDAIDINGAGHGDYWGHSDTEPSWRATAHAGDFLELGRHARTINARAAAVAGSRPPRRDPPTARSIG